MVATTDQKARLLDLVTGVLELVRDGKRDASSVADTLQAVKDDPNFSEKFGNKAPSAVAVVSVSRSTEEQLVAWTLLYREVFGEEHDFSSLAIPPQKPGFTRLIVVANGMTPNCIFTAMRKLFPAWRYTKDLDVITSVRKPNKDYAVWVRDRQEADEERAGKSALDLERSQVNGITLEERMLLEVIYFRETGRHLDERNWTLCTGSRDPDGDVPYVYWNADKLSVNWCNADLRLGNLRAREAVS